MKEDGALVTGVEKKLKKEYCAEIQLQETALWIQPTIYAMSV